MERDYGDLFHAMLALRRKKASMMWVAWVVPLLLAATPAFTHAQAEDEFCLGCHQAPDAIGPPVEVEAFGASTHGVFACLSCHDTAEEVPHPEGMAQPACGACHVPESEEYGTGVHGQAQAASEAASCIDCHGGPHAVRGARDPESWIYPLNLPRTCGRCHGNPELAERTGISVENVYQLYLDSTHGKAVTESGLLVAATCSSCHGAHSIRPAEDPVSTVHRANVPATCGACHAGILAPYDESIHGRAAAAGNLDAPVCVDCHTAHETRRVETAAWQLDIVRECGTCHSEALRTYRDTFHGQVSALGFTRVARCSDCHGGHEILPASDPTSRINPANLVTTCGSCHSAANANFVKYDPHADPKDRARNPTLYYAAQLMRWLLFGVFSFFGAHAALWGVRELVVKWRR